MLAFSMEMHLAVERQPPEIVAAPRQQSMTSTAKALGGRRRPLRDQPNATALPDQPAAWCGRVGEGFVDARQLELRKFG